MTSVICIARNSRFLVAGLLGMTNVVGETE